MQALRTTALRSSRRSFATVADATGVKIASLDHGQPTSSVTFLVKAGSRYEPQPGVANLLKNFAFRGTASRSALGTVRETELLGGVLSTSLTREHLAISAEFLREDAPYFIELLSSVITSTRFTRWELEESVLPTAQAETQAAHADARTVAIELAHAAAFRNGLGSSIFAPAHTSVTAENVKSFASSVFGKGNIAVLGSGIDQGTLSSLVSKHLGSLGEASAQNASSTKYFGGQVRRESHEGPQTVFIGFGVPGAPTAELSALAHYLNPAPSIKWSSGTSPLSASIPQNTSVQSVIFPYSDATLFGLLVQSETVEGAKVAGQAVVKALKESSTSSGVKPEDVKKAIAKAKFAAASAAESRDGFVSALGPQVLGNGINLSSVLSSLDSVNASSFFKATSSLVRAEPTYVAVGDVNALPYKDELGL